MIPATTTATEDRSEAATSWTRTFCPYCGVGCGLLAGTSGGRVVRVKGDPAHPSNLGDVCPKAIHLPKVLPAPDRLRYPHMRSRRTDALTRVSWDEALGRVAKEMRSIITRHGPDAVAMYGSGQLLTEDYYVANKLLKGFLGTNNFDTNSRLCMASAVAGYTLSLGSDGPPVTYADIDQAHCFFILGANMAACHPVLLRRIERRKKERPGEVRVIVVDPRRTTTADIADLHVPIRPGTDVAFLNAMLHVIAAERLEDTSFIDAHTAGWEALRASVASCTPDYAEEICELKATLIADLARVFAAASGTISLWSMGINQSAEGVHKNRAIINLHLATGQIGRPGAGPFSLTGQPTAMGGRETGGLSHLLPGYRRVEEAAHRAEIAGIWGVPETHLSPRPGYSAVELFEAVAAGRVRAIWIVATNPAVSMPDPDLVERALRRADLVVVQDAYHPTDTSALADVLLPAAQWAEKEGTMTNSERVITHLPKIVDPPGEALPDWEIFARFARTLGCTGAFPYTSAEEVFDEYRRCTAGRLTDISGLTYERLRKGPVRWPCPAADHPGGGSLYMDRIFPTPDGKARFLPTPYAGPQEAPDPAYPLVLTTGRSRHHWHTMTRTRHVPSFQKMEPEPVVELNRTDALKRAVRDGDFVEVTSRRGKIIAQARVTDEVRAGTCFVPFHWGRRAGYYKAANNLTLKAFDPVSKQPELKHAAVEVRRMDADGCGAGNEGIP